MLEKLNETFFLADLTTFQQIFDFGLSFSKVNSILLRSMLQVSLILIPFLKKKLLNAIGIKLIVLPRVPLEKMVKMKDILLNSIQKLLSPPILNQK